MKRYLIIILIGLLFCMTECKKAEKLNTDIVGLGGDIWEQTALDKWILTNFTEPYNISVKYRWDGSEYNVSKTLVPPKLEKVQPLLETVRGCWIDPYTAEIGQNFIKRFAPKQYVLVGSLQYNGNTVTLGEAEGGIKVTLFNVNNFSKANRGVTKRILKTIHHEFTHILHQTIMFQKEFPLITKGYTGDWNNQTEYAAKGFISQYAQAAPEEDFVEMTSIMLTEGKTAYEAILNNYLKTAVAAIRAKEQLVVTYFKQTWDIDFYRLQNRVQIAINATSPNNPVDFLGFRKPFTSLNTISPDNLPDLSSDFINVYNTAKTGLFGLDGEGRILDNIAISYPEANQLALKVNFHDKAEKKYTATFTYKLTTNADGSIKLKPEPVSTDDPNKIASDINSLTNYLTQNTFVYKMYYSSDLMNEYMGLAKATDPTSFFYGVAGN